MTQSLPVLLESKLALRDQIPSSTQQLPNPLLLIAPPKNAACYSSRSQDPILNTVSHSVAKRQGVSRPHRAAAALFRHQARYISVPSAWRIFSRISPSSQCSHKYPSTPARLHDPQLIRLSCRLPLNITHDSTGQRTLPAYSSRRKTSS